MPESINQVKFKGSNATDFSDIKQLKLKFNETKTVYAWNKPYTLTVDTTELNNPVNKTNVPSYNIIRANTYEPLVTGQEVLDKVNINQTLMEGSASNLITNRKELPIYHGDEISFKKVSNGDIAHYNYSNLPFSGYLATGNITIKPTQTLKTFTITVNNTEHSESIIERPENNSPYGHGGVMGGCMSSASVFAGDNIYVFLRPKEGYNITSTKNYVFNDVTSNKTVNVTTEERSGTLTIKKYVDDTVISSLGSEQFFTYSGNITRDNTTKTSFTNNADPTWTYSNGVKYWDRYSVSVDSINSNIVSMVTASSFSGNVTDSTTITLKAQRKMGMFHIMKSGVVLTNGTSVVQSSGSSTDFSNYSNGDLSVGLINNITGSSYSATATLNANYQTSIYALDSFSVTGSANTGYQYLGLSTSSGSQSISYSPGVSYTYPDARTSTFYPVFKVNTYSGSYYHRSVWKSDSADKSVLLASSTYSATYNSTRTISPSTISGFTFDNEISYYVNEGDAQATTVIGSSATFTVRAVNGGANNYDIIYRPNTYTLKVSLGVSYSTQQIKDRLYGYDVGTYGYSFFTGIVYRKLSPYTYNPTGTTDGIVTKFEPANVSGYYKLSRKSGSTMMAAYYKETFGISYTMRPEYEKYFIPPTIFLGSDANYGISTNTTIDLIFYPNLRNYKVKAKLNSGGYFESFIAKSTKIFFFRKGNDIFKNLYKTTVSEVMNIYAENLESLYNRDGWTNSYDTPVKGWINANSAEPTYPYRQVNYGDNLIMLIMCKSTEDRSDEILEISCNGGKDSFSTIPFASFKHITGPSGTYNIVAIELAYTVTSDTDFGEIDISQSD